LTIAQVVRRRTPSVTDAVSGLLFPGDQAEDVTYRFNWTDPPSPYPMTYIWRCRPDEQAQYFTNFFYGLGDGSDPLTVVEYLYYGAHPYIDGKWEVAANQNDYRDDDNANNTDVVWGSFVDQSLTVEDAGGGNLTYRFQWDLSNESKVISETLPNLGPSPDDRIIVGDAPWNAGDEVWKGVLRGKQIYTSKLTLAQIQARKNPASSAAVVAANPGSLWYVNANWTPTDISDKSGNGNHPVWVGANRPTLWTP
jgi:hypothetical protein